MANFKGTLKTKNANGTADILYPKTTIDQVENLSTTLGSFVDLSNNQVIKGQKDFTNIPRIVDEDGVVEDTLATLSDIPNDYVDLFSNQVIDGQKDFDFIPRVKIEGTGGEDHNLPDRYIELNYIYINKQFVGTTTNSNYQFIDSGIIPDSTIEFEFSFSYENAGPGSATGSGVGMGARVSSTSAVCSLSGYSSFPTGYFGFNNNQRFEAYLVQGDNLVSFRYDPNDDTKGIYTCINSSGIHTHTINRNYTYPNTIKSLYIGALHDGNNPTENLTGKIYYVKIWKNKTLVREYYPCLHENTIGLYDKISNELFTNIGNGIGNFTAGEPIKDAYYDVLTNANFAAVAFTGSYSDLSNRPTNLNQFTNGPGYVTSSYHDSTKANQSSVDAINAKIPSAASSSNQLADKAFVNSSIETSTATFKGTYDSIAEIEALTADDNDYAFYRHTDSAGNTLFDRYKYDGTSWLYEYTLNNSSFTAAQWSAINSGVSTGSWVDTTTTQTIDGQKDFEVVPRVKVTHQTHNLPSEYQEVEYIESSGTQYINTGFVPTSNNYGFDIDLLVVNTPNTANGYIGYRSVSVAAIAGDMRYCFIYGDKRLAIRNGVSADNSTSTIVLNQKYNFNYSSGSLKINGVEQVSCTQYSANPTFKTFYLFKANTDNYYSADLGTFTGRIYEAKLYDNGTLVRDFIPCYRISDNEPGMYDLETETFFVNSGTGDFEVGPDIEVVTYESLLTDANFSQVAFSGSYNDLSNKPTIPTVNNATLTIQKNGTTVNTFTANASSNVTANITVPDNTDYVDLTTNQEISGVKTFLTDDDSDPTNAIFIKSDYEQSEKLRLHATGFEYLDHDGLVDVGFGLPTNKNNGWYTLATTSDIPSDYVNLTTNQVIDGQKDFEVLPRVKVEHTIHNLPNTYQEVEYLESTGTQYIDTGVILTNLHAVEIDYQLTSTQQTNRRGLYGILSTNAASRFGSLFSPTNYYLEHGYGVTNVYWQQGLPDANRHLLKQDKNITYMDGVAIHTFNEATFTTTGNALLGNFNYTNYIPALAKYYESKWWNDGVLIRDFIPCYRKSDDKPGYYDIVNDVFYINAGTGDFVLGPNVEPITYESLLTDASFSTVATTGNYNDLINKPTIPTKTSSLTNDSGFVTNSILAPSNATSCTISGAEATFTFTNSPFSTANNKWMGTFTMGNCFFMIPLYGMQQSTMYKCPGTFVYDSRGSVVTTTMNFIIDTNNTIRFWSGNSNYNLQNNFVAYLSLLKLF